MGSSPYAEFAQCSLYSFRFWADGKKAEGTFTGPFNATLENPILLMSNTADPNTSLKSGRALNRLLGKSSRLVVQNYPGAFY
jgi:hypothetical protein